MEDFILQHRERLTREAITARLEEAGLATSALIIDSMGY